MIRKSVLLILLPGLASGCASHFSAPLDWKSLEKLERASRDRTGSVEQSGEFLGSGHSFAFSPRQISFVTYDGDLQEVFLDSPVTLSVDSKMAGAKKGFWIGALASAGGVLVALLEIDAKDTGEMEALPLVLGATGLVGGSIGAVIGASVGGTFRFEIGGFQVSPPSKVRPWSVRDGEDYR